MKISKYIASALVLLAAVACQRGSIKYPTTSLAESGKTAEFQLHTFVPQSEETKYAIDSVFVNGVLYSSVLGSGQLVGLNGVPGGTVGRFFAVEPGNVNFKLMRGDSVLFDQNVTLKSGKCNIVIWDYTKAPIVLDNEFPYFNATRKLDLAHFDTDTVASVRFINFLFEESGKPYEGKLQYQYREYNTKDTIGYDEAGKPITEYNCWKNVGEPVAFGETTKRTLVHVDKLKGINYSGRNSSGSQYLYYRILDEQGQVLQGWWSTTATKLSDYSDYWTAYIGRVYNHFLCGCRNSKKNTATETYARVKVWTSL